MAQTRARAKQRFKSARFILEQEHAPTKQISRGLVSYLISGCQTSRALPVDTLPLTESSQSVSLFPRLLASDFVRLLRRKRNEPRESERKDCSCRHWESLKPISPSLRRGQGIWHSTKRIGKRHAARLSTRHRLFALEVEHLAWLVRVWLPLFWRLSNQAHERSYIFGLASLVQPLGSDGGDGRRPRSVGGFQDWSLTRKRRRREGCDDIGNKLACRWWCSSLQRPLAHF